MELNELSLSHSVRSRHLLGRKKGQTKSVDETEGGDDPKGLGRGRGGDWTRRDDSARERGWSQYTSQNVFPHFCPSGTFN